MDQNTGNMPAGKEKEEDSGVFHVVLYPQRSLSQKGFFLLMAVMLAGSMIVGGMFWGHGAWPVTGFYGLELFVVWYAFRLSYKSGREYETIRLNERVLIVEDHSNRQGQKLWVFNPYDARVVLGRTAGANLPGRLLIFSGRQGVEIGAFLSAEERKALAASLDEALRRWRVEALRYCDPEL